MDAFNITIDAKLLGKLDDIYTTLNTFNKLLISKTADNISVAFIEKVNVNKEPKEFFILTFKKDEIIITYVIPENVPPSVRKWSVLKKCFPLITAVSKYYKINVSVLMNLIETLLQDLISLIPKDSKQLYVENEKLRSKLNELEQKIEECNKNKDEISSKLYDLTTQLENCRANLKKYEIVSDELVRVKIINWLKEHKGEIDIAQFSKIHNIPESKVERVLKEMVDENYIIPL